MGHRAKDLTCLKNNLDKKQSVQLYTAREIVEEDDSTEEQVLDEDHSESQNELEEEDPYYGSQYS